MIADLAINLEAPCWLWNRSISPDGYGRLWVGDDWRTAKIQVAHRYVWMMMRGPIPAGMTLDHLCRVRHCLNPQHLEIVTRAENVMRGVGHGPRNKAKTHCPQGHEYNSENTYWHNGWRQCITCRHFYSLSANRHRARQ